MIIKIPLKSSNPIKKLSVLPIILWWMVHSWFTHINKSHQNPQCQPWINKPQTAV